MTQRGDHLGPFLTGFNPMTGTPMGAVAADDRVAMVREFNEAQCRAALQVPGLQRKVHQAIEQRMRELEAEHESRR